MVISLYTLIFYILFLIYIGSWLGYIMFTIEISNLLITSCSYKWGTWIFFIKSLNTVKNNIHKSGRPIIYKIDSKTNILMLIAIALKSEKPDSLVLKPEFEYLLENDNITLEKDDIVSCFSYNFCLIENILLIFDPISYLIYSIWRLYRRLNSKKY